MSDTERRKLARLRKAYDALVASTEGEANPPDLGAEPAEATDEAIAARRAVVEERDWLLRALADQAGFELSLMGVQRRGLAPPLGYFRYERAGKTVEVMIKVSDES